jgi:hypothetical protein
MDFECEIVFQGSSFGFWFIHRSIFGLLDNLFAWLTALALAEFLESSAGMVALTSL